MLEIPYASAFDTDSEYEEDSCIMMNSTSSVSCVLLAPKYEYMGQDKTESKVHSYLTKVNFLPPPLHAKFFEEIAGIGSEFLRRGSDVKYVCAHAEPKHVIKSIQDAVDEKPKLLFVMFVGHGTAEKGMVLQNHCSMSQAELHRVVTRSKFSGTLIEVYCMCYAKGTSYSPTQGGSHELSSMERYMNPRFSIHSSTFHSQKYSVGLAFLRKLRRTIFDEDHPLYSDLTPDLLHASSDEVDTARKDLGYKSPIEEDEDIYTDIEENESRLKKNQMPCVQFCGRDVVNSDVFEALSGLKFFDALPSL
jgi:hypothetical protein